MPHTIQITVDCHDPHTLADWWAETLQWEVEPQDEAFIRSMINQGHATDADTMMHNGSLVWSTGAAIRPPEVVAGQPRLLFQQVPEDKTAKNRMHVDIRPEEGSDVETLRNQLIERGATVLWEGQQGPHTWVTMADPEGNEFCI